ncbi:MAG: hypothetical protein Q9M24_07480 [Mariprofundaceae bacterium]|nr:hypothetical protein [Mariprofundaceae bacterium]
MNTIASRLDALRNIWLEQSGISENFALMGLADINKQHVTDTLADLSRMAAKLDNAAPADMVMTHRSCEEMIQIAESYLAEHLKDRNSIHMLGFLTLLKQIRVTLVGALAQHMQMPATNKTDTSQAA